MKDNRIWKETKTSLYLLFYSAAEVLSFILMTAAEDNKYDFFFIVCSLFLGHQAQ
tara:strand:- start:582 stop:746 length:165 start_codon:yes stop_codon:yes gene_type:complete